MSSQQHEAKENTAAVGFMALLALCLGGAGVLVAALAIGVERAWSGRQGGPGSAGWGQSVADHRTWLDADRQRRVAARKARQQWWRDGADPATRPAQAPRSVRVGSAFRRWWARLFVSADRIHEAGGRFGEGFRAGWAAAQQARRGGADPWQIARARPVDKQPEGAATPDVPAGSQEGVTPPQAATADPAAKPNPEPETKPSLEAAAEPQPQSQDPASAAQPQTEQNTDTAETTATAGGTSMTAPTTAPAGETHLDLTDADLAAIHGHLARVQELNDQMAGVRGALEGAVAAANERAAAKGATAATQQALDEANAVVGVLGQHVSGVADATTAASDHTSAAQAGLKPAQDAQDALHSAGAKGEFVSTATSD